MEKANPDQAIARRVSQDCRIIYVIPGNQQGNNMIFARMNAAELRKRNFEIVEFYLESRTSPIKLAREFLRLRNTIRSFEPSIVHAQYGAVTGLVAIIASLDRYRVLSVRGSDINKLRSIGYLRNRIGRLMTRVSAFFSDVVICSGSDLKRQLWRIDESVRVVPSGVDVSVFKPMEKPAARISAGIALNDPIILFNSAKAPVLKGLSIVECAMRIVRKRYPTARLIVLNGDRTREDVALLMNGADCFVLASEAEGSPNVIREAMACNLPIVSVPVGDVVDRLREVEPSRIVQRNADEIAEGITQILGLRTRSNGRSQITAQRLAHHDTVESLAHIYRRLVARK